MKTKRYVDHRSRMWLPAISLLLLSSFSGVAQRNEVKATGPKINFCDVLPPNVTRPGSFDISPKLPYGASSCPDLFRVRWVNANNTYVHSLPLKHGHGYTPTCGTTEMRQIIHRENLDTATGTTHFTLISDSTNGCSKATGKKLGGGLSEICSCGNGLTAVVDKGANYRVYVGCVEKASPTTSSIPKQCEFRTWTDDKK